MERGIGFLTCLIYYSRVDVISPFSYWYIFLYHLFFIKIDKRIVMMNFLWTYLLVNSSACHNNFFLYFTISYFFRLYFYSKKYRKRKVSLIFYWDGEKSSCKLEEMCVLDKINFLAYVCARFFSDFLKIESLYILLNSSSA